MEFRKLSLRYHPDVSNKSECGEMFKSISNAHSVLSNPVLRKKYDRRLFEDAEWRLRQDVFRKNGAGGGSGFHYRRPNNSKSGILHLITSSRYITMGAIGLGGVAFLGSLLGGITSKRPEYHHHGVPLVEAWKNPTTKRWETPAPWDPVYQRTKPKLEMIPREKVWRRQL